MEDRKQTVIDVYRANIADPKDLSSTLFWIKNELVRIQGTSFSTEKVLKDVVSAVYKLSLGGNGVGVPGEKGDPGAKGAKGDTGAQGEQGEKGDPGDGAASLILDGETSELSLWSSSKTSLELSNKMDLHEYARWESDGYSQETTYPLWSIMATTGYLSIANRATQDYPFPTQVNPVDRLYPDAPVWASVSSFTGQVRSGYQIAFSQSGELSEAQVWVTDVASDTMYWLVVIQDADNTEGGARTIRILLDSSELSANQWSSVAMPVIYANKGDTLFAFLESQKSTTGASFQGDYEYSGVIGFDDNPDVAGFLSINTQNNLLKVNNTDGLSASPALNTITVGSTLLVETTTGNNFFEYIVIGTPVAEASWYEFPVQLIRSGGEMVPETACTFVASLRSPLATEYISETAKWNTQPSWGTFTPILQHDGVLQTVASEGFGVNFNFQQMEQSEDWDLIPLGTGSGAAPSGAYVEIGAPQITATFEGNGNQLNCGFIEHKDFTIPTTTIYIGGPTPTIPSGNHPYSYTKFDSDELYDFTCQNWFPPFGYAAGQIMPPYIRVTGEKQFGQDMYALSGGVIFQATPIVTHKAGLSSINLSGIVSLQGAPQFLIKDGCAATAAGLFIGNAVQPNILACLGTGTLNLSGAIFYDFYSSLLNVNSGQNGFQRAGFYYTETQGASVPSVSVGLKVDDLNLGDSVADVQAGPGVMSGHWGIYQSHERGNKWGGSHHYKTRAITASRTLDKTDHIIITDLTAVFNGVVFPAITSAANGREYIIKYRSGQACLIIPSTGDTIDGAANSFVSSGSARYIADAATNDWVLI